MLPLLGSLNKMSDSMPSFKNHFLMKSQTGVSFPVGIEPVFTEGIRTSSCSSITSSSSSASSWFNISSKEAII